MRQDWTLPSFEIRLVEVVGAQQSLLAEELWWERTLEPMLDHIELAVVLGCQIVGDAADLGKDRSEVFHSIVDGRASCWCRNVLGFELVMGHGFDLE